MKHAAPPPREQPAKAPSAKAPSLPLGCPPSFMRDAHKPGSIPSYGTAGASRGLGGASRGTTVLSGGLTVATESPYQPVDSAMEESMSAMSVGDDPDEGGVDLGDPLAVLHAQLEYYEKFRGGIVLGNYRCAPPTPRCAAAAQVTGSFAAADQSARSLSVF